MTIVPTFDSPCNLAHDFPPVLANFLDLARRLSRPFREDSVTDILIASFIACSKGEVVILTPPEKLTASDFDLTIVSLAGSEAIRYRIQAKKLHPHKADWWKSTYRELAHPNNKGTQAEDLVSEVNLLGDVPTYPLYAFYNPMHICAAGGIEGIALADGYSVAQIVSDAVAYPGSSLKRLDSLMPHFFPLSTILCPPTTAKFVEDVVCATPRQSRDRLVAAVRTNREKIPTGRKSAETEAILFRSDPSVGPLPPHIRLALELAGDVPIRLAKVDRPQIVIAADRPPPAK